MEFTVSYTASFTCSFDKNNPLDNSCSRNALITVATQTKTPLANEIWARLVAGNSAVFKRIFPKLGKNTPIEALVDMPAASNVTYTDKTTGNPIQAGNPDSARAGTSAELYFPHIGGVQEYFLDAIQTAIRPKGFGKPIVSGKPPGGNLPPGGNYGLCEKPQTPPDYVPSGGCQISTSGYCNWTNLRNYWSTDRAAKQASIICGAESGGDPTATNCSCLSGGSWDYSIGLFQINL